MSRFYGTLSGQAKTAATRRGGPGSGVCAHVRGWHVGIRADVAVDDEGRDVVRIYLTGGSSPAISPLYLGKVTRKETGIEVAFDHVSPVFEVKDGAR